MIRLEKVPDEIENLVTSRWCSRGIWTFIQCIDNKIDRNLCWKIDHFPKTFDERSITGLIGAKTARRIHPMNSIPAMVRFVNELEENGC